MIHALSKEGRRSLRSLPTQSILYGFDFDGTLVRLSADRESVALSRSMQEWLAELSKRVPCAIVSGRALSDLAPRLRGTVPHLIGNHGLESPLTAPSTLNRAEAICVEWARAAQAEWFRTLEGHGMDLEHKRYTLTLHYRNAADPVRAHRAAVDLLQQLAPAPRLTFGHACVNALPPGHAGKGAAAFALMKRLGQTGLFYIGDDGADEEVFELPEGLAVGMRVGKCADSRARFYVDHQGEVEEVVRFLVHRLDRTPEAGESDEVAGAKKTA